MISVELLVLSVVLAFPTSVLSLSHEHSARHPHWYARRDYITPAQRSASYDYVVAGGGLAGLIVASRLSNDPSKSVLVLEAGPSGDTLRAQIDVPGDTYYRSMLAQPGFNWGYSTVPQPNANNRPMTQPRGRTLGGSAAINGLYIVRPPKTQADAWRDLIAAGNSDEAQGSDLWGWDSIYSTLKKLETFTPPTADAQATANFRYQTSSLGTNGRLHVTYPGYMVPVTGNWFPALEAAGISINSDGFSGDNVGGFFALSAINPSNWTRSYSKTGWIDTLPPRSNLHIISEATVEQVVFADSTSDSGRQATGVRFSNGRGTESFEVKVNKEVILAGGAMGTPHMLLVSGVGPRDVLEAAGVDVKVELPGVGQHLMDHLAAGVYYQATTDTQGSIRASGSALSQTPEFNSFVNSGVAYLNGSLLFESTENLETFRATISAESASSAASADRVPSQYKEVRDGYKAIYDATVGKLYKDDGLIEVLLSINRADQIVVQCALQLPMSQGRIYINSSSIYDPLLIDPQYFSHPADLTIMRQGIKLARRIGSSAPFADAVGVEQAPGPEIQTDEQIENWLKETVGTEFHPTGTAAMLPRNQGGVVDARLKVYGTSNVRVVDAAVFPVSFSAHMMTPVYALAELAVDVINGTTASSNGGSTSGGGSNSNNNNNGNGNGTSGASALRLTSGSTLVAVAASGLVGAFVAVL